jgi:hypothetical protein
MIPFIKLIKRIKIENQRSESIGCDARGKKFILMVAIKFANLKEIRTNQNTFAQEQQIIMYEIGKRWQLEAVFVEKQLLLWPKAMKKPNGDFATTELLNISPKFK